MTADELTGVRFWVYGCLLSGAAGALLLDEPMAFFGGCSVWLAMTSWKVLVAL